MKSLTVRIIVVLAIAAIAAIAIVFSGPTAPLHSAAPQNAGSTTTSAQAIQVSSIPAGTVRAVGTFSSANQASLGFQSAGRVKDIKVKEGDTVKAGDLLATLDTTMLDLQVVQAQASLNTAQAKLDTLKNP